MWQQEQLVVKYKNMQNQYKVMIMHEVWVEVALQSSMDKSIS